MTRTITAVNWNFENNGKSDPEKRLAGHQMLKSLDPDLVLRQEMWDAGDHGQQVMSELEGALGMRGWLGEKSCTGLFVRPELFAPVRVWSSGPIWVLPPTALTMHYTPAGPEALPLVLVAYHLNYASATNRLAEVEWLSTWADKKQVGPDGRMVTLPVLMGGDNNSYPVPGTPGDPALPELEAIPDRPHRLHRSYVGPDGERRMDDRPDEALRTAGLQDVARYRAGEKGETAAVARTVTASPTHGTDSRIDRVYATPQLLPAVTGVDVVEVPLDMSDHHVVRVQLDAEVLADILNEPSTMSA
ncbi:endonuclease/exonuclease/phosphatase family protein [Streptomyces albus]|uniref:endonuclease/exonuclease/phosphatase family protein n=1 Tax=Streptomyces albus TaxID=1888 RepID=UPI003F1D6380